MKLLFLIRKRKEEHGNQIKYTNRKKINLNKILSVLGVIEVEAFNFVIIMDNCLIHLFLPPYTTQLNTI